MAYTLVLGNKNYSSWSLRPWFLLHKFSIAFDEIVLELDCAAFYEEIVKYNEAKKVPVLIHDDFAVSESLAIIEYVAEQHRDLSIWPRHSQVRAQARMVCAEMHSGFAALRANLPMNCRATGRVVEPDAATSADIERVQAIWTKCRNDHGVGGVWLFGEFSAADAMFAPVASRFRSYGIDANLNSTCRRYVDTVLADPSYELWLAASQRETRVLKTEEVGAPD